MSLFDIYRPYLDYCSKLTPNQSKNDQLAIKINEWQYNNLIGLLFENQKDFLEAFGDMNLQKGFIAFRERQKNHEISQIKAAEKKAQEIAYQKSQLDDQLKKLAREQDKLAIYLTPLEEKVKKLQQKKK